MENKNNSSVFQAVEDLRKTALSQGLDDLANTLKEVLSDCPDYVLSEADKVFASHVYPDYSLQWVKMPVKGYSCSVLDTLPPDAFSLLMRLIYRLSSYSPFVAFKKSDLIDITGWSLSKVTSVLQVLKDQSVLAVYDDYNCRSFGTIYMINPNLIDVSGTSQRKGLYSRIWKNLTDLGSGDDEMYSLSNDRKVTVLDEPSGHRVNVSIIENKNFNRRHSPVSDGFKKTGSGFDIPDDLTFEENV